MVILMGFIKSVGVELECAMNDLSYKNFLKDVQDTINAKYNAPDVNMKKVSNFNNKFENGSDSSIKSAKSTGRELRYWSSVDDIDELKEFLDIAYKHIEEVNWTCGFHTHLGMPENDLKIATYEPFHSMFLTYYKSKFKGIRKYENRLLNYYCSPDYKIEKGKYNAVNVEHQKTVEIRVLPYQNDSNEAFSTIKWTIETVDEILQRLHKKMSVEFKTDIKLNEKKGKTFRDIELELRRFEIPRVLEI
jgi:hypothetical protein